MRVPRQYLFLVILALVVGAGLVLQRQSNAALRDVIVLFRGRNQELIQLEAQHGRLVRAQASAAELESLRADHAAIERLRGEVETAKKRLGELERADSAPASQK